MNYLLEGNLSNLLENFLGMLTLFITDKMIAYIFKL